MGVKTSLNADTLKKRTDLMKKPRILLSGKLKAENYLDAVLLSGGEGVFEYIPQNFKGYDGLILCGGNDVDPSFYDEDDNGSVNIDTKRDKAEFEILKHFIAEKKPILGICRGCQIINVFFGGSLFGHIENSEKHTSNADFDLVHTAFSVEGSALNDLYGDEFKVNSAHHQAIKKLGAGLKITMTAFDKTVEGIEHESLPIIAVQWHPERMCYKNKREDTVDGAEIFKTFIKMCSDNMG